MAQSLAHHIPESILEAPKNELVQMVVRARNLAKSYKLKEHAAHTGKSLLCTLTGAAGGGTAGLIGAFEMVAHIPKTKIRTDLVVGGLITLAAAFEVFDGASRYIGEYGNGMIDFGVGDVTRNLVRAHRAQTATVAAAPAATRNRAA